MVRFCFPFIAILLVLSSCHKEQNNKESYVVILSMDGFRWDYTEKVATPNFDRIAKLGVKAEALIPSFPTKTFPNHYSIATGLYPDHHGIVLNSFYDEEMDRYYEIADRVAVEDGAFYGGEPLWVTAEKQGIKTASYFWVGSESEIAGYRPSYWKKYDHDFPYRQRIDSVINWLQKPEESRPGLILWYFDEPDHTGHDTGPDSHELNEKIVELDKHLGYFLDQVEQLPIAEKINIIVTSDHGMCNISDDRKVLITDYVDVNWIAELQGYNPNFNIKAKEGCIDSIYNALVGIEGLSIWKSTDVPEYLNYGSHIRTLDLVLVADSSWSVVVEPETNVGNGAHGFDNTNTTMFAIFYAFGPAFKSDYTAPKFNNVDIYPLICEILELDPAPVDGKLENVKGMLKDKKGK